MAPGPRGGRVETPPRGPGDMPLGLSLSEGLGISDLRLQGVSAGFPGLLVASSGCGFFSRFHRTFEVVLKLCLLGFCLFRLHSLQFSSRRGGAGDFYAAA